MPVYRDPDSGKTITVDHPPETPPTEQELEGMFASGGSRFAFAGASPKGGLLDALKGSAATQAGNIKEGVVGAAKGAGSTVYGLGKLFSPLVKGSMLAPAAGDFPAQKPDELVPSNDAQKVGYGAEQVGEFIAPGGLVAKAGKGLPLAARMALESATTAGTTAAQTGEMGPEAGAAGLIGSLGPLAGAALSKMAPQFRAGAEKAMSQFLGPTTARMKGKAAKAVPGMLERGVSGSRLGVLSQAEQGMAATGPEYATVEATQGGAKVDTQGAVDTLEKLKQRFMANQAPSGIGPAAPAAATPGAAARIDQIQGLQDSIAKTEPTLSSVRALRSILGDETEKSFGKLPVDQQQAEKIKLAAYQALRTELHKTSPDLAALDKEFSFWSNVKDVLTATERRSKPQEGGLLKTVGHLASVGAGALGLATHEPRVLGAAIVFDALQRVAATPAWKSWSAVRKDGLARALSSGRYDVALGLIGRGLASTTADRSADQSATQ